MRRLASSEGLEALSAERKKPGTFFFFATAKENKCHRIRLLELLFLLHYRHKVVGRMLYWSHQEARCTAVGVGWGVKIEYVKSTPSGDYHLKKHGWSFQSRILGFGIRIRLVLHNHKPFCYITATYYYMNVLKSVVTDTFVLRQRNDHVKINNILLKDLFIQFKPNPSIESLIRKN